MEGAGNAAPHWSFTGSFWKGEETRVWSCQDTVGECPQPWLWVHILVLLTPLHDPSRLINLSAFISSPPADGGQDLQISPY